MNKKKNHPRVKRFFKILGLAIVCLFFAGFTYERVAEYIDSKSITPPGQMVQVGDNKLHIYCIGENINGSPTVILEAGAGNFYTSWKKVNQKFLYELRSVLTTGLD